MDSIDKELLKILMENSRAAATEISAKLHLSIPAVNKRIAKLKMNGIIEKYTIQVNPKNVEKSVQAFILLVVNQYPQVNALMDFVNEQKDIIDCYAITGEYDYMIKVCAKDIEHLEEILLRLKEHNFVSKSYTMFALMEHKHLPGPLPDDEDAEIEPQG